MEMAGKTKVGKLIDLKPAIPCWMFLFFGMFYRQSFKLLLTNSCNEMGQETTISFSLEWEILTSTRFNLTKLHGYSDIL